MKAVENKILDSIISILTPKCITLIGTLKSDDLSSVIYTVMVSGRSESIVYNKTLPTDSLGPELTYFVISIFSYLCFWSLEVPGKVF